MNQLRIRAKAVAKSALRYTPAGVAVLEASFEHEGSVTEAAVERTLAFEFSAIALGAVAQSLDREPLGTTLMLRRIHCAALASNNAAAGAHHGIQSDQS